MPIKLEKSDRRHTVINQDTPLPQSIAHALSPDINPGVLEKELKDFVSWMKTLTPNFAEVEKFYPTEEKTRIIAASRDSVELFLEELMEFDSIKGFCQSYNHSFAVDNVSRDKQFDEFILTRDLYELYTFWCSKNFYKYNKSQVAFGMVMGKQFGVKSQRNRAIEKGGQRFYLVEEMKENITND